MTVGQTVSVRAIRKPDNVLAKVDRARILLAEAKTLIDVKQVIALADAAIVYAKRIEAGNDAINTGAEFKLRAERRLGEILKETPKNNGSRGIGKSGVPKKYPTRADSGISKKLSSRAQLLAETPSEEFEDAMKTSMPLDIDRRHKSKQEISSPLFG